MTRVLLYWNHICVLQKGERQFLDGLAASLISEGICLEVRYFGLGYPEHMSEYLAKPEAQLPDILVSSDLEVFEDKRIYTKMQDALYPAAGWLRLRQGAALDAVWRNGEMLPFLAIPLVYYTREPELCRQTPLPEWEGLAFGGIDNSAVKTVVKAVWSRWGEDAAGRLLERSRVSPMPIAAFQMARSGQCHTALVPSLYALRADGKESFLCMPQEGPVLIPTYFCACRSIPEAVARRIAEKVLCPELCAYYREQGDLITYPAYGEAWSRQECGTYLTSSAAWLDTLDAEAFHAWYRSHLP